MSHSPEEEERELYESFFDQLNELRCELKQARDRAEVSMEFARPVLLKMLERIQYTLKEYYHEPKPRVVN